MYDTHNLWESMESANNINLFADIPYYIENATQHNDKRGQPYINGNLQNYIVNIYQYGISLKGSIAKYYYGDNFQILTRGDYQKAIEKLNDTLHLNFYNAKVNRFDIGVNLQMKYDCNAYYSLLGDLHHYKRLEQPTSVNYVNSLRQLILYNKIAEAKAKRFEIPEVYKNENVLRVEFRYLRQLPTQLKQPEITPKTLCNEQFYIQIVDKWINEYQKINKQNSVQIDFNVMKNAKDLDDLLRLWGLQYCGGELEFLKLIEQAKQQGVFKYYNEEKRYKEKIKKIGKTPKFTGQSDLIKELNEKIERIKTIYI